MKISKIYPSSNFIKAYRKLPGVIKLLAKKKEEIFINNPFDPRLKAHKLGGRLKGYWSFSIDYHYRIILRFIDNESVLYLDIGTHGIYK